MKTTHYAINIGRQFGSGGREIGKILAERLGISFYDKELITIASQKSGLSKEFFEKADEKASRSYMISASDPDMGERLLSLIPRESQELCFAVHQPFLRESIARRFGKIRVSECRQAV